MRTRSTVECKFSNAPGQSRYYTLTRTVERPKNVKFENNNRPRVFYFDLNAHRNGRCADGYAGDNRSRERIDKTIIFCLGPSSSPGEREIENRLRPYVVKRFAASFVTGSRAFSNSD